MHKLLAGCAGILAVACAASLQGADAPASITPYSAIPGEAVPSPAAAPEPQAPSPTAANQFIAATLNDGSKVEFDADGAVFVVGADGAKTPAPDGMLTLKDGTPFTVKDGKRVSEAE